MHINKKIIIIGAAGLLVLALLVVGAVFLVRRLGSSPEAAIVSYEVEAAGEAARKRRNTMDLAREYFTRGDYDRALALLDSLLIDNPADDEARRIRDDMLERRRLAKAADVPPEERAGREAEAAVRAAEDAEKRAAAEAEAARRRAREEEMARLSRELRERMDAVLDLVSQGKGALGRKDYSGAVRAFDDARSRLPPGEDRFIAQVFADMADAWYGAGDTETPEGRDAIKRAGDLAREAIAKDPGQALPHYTLGKIHRDLRRWDDAVSELKEASRLDPKSYLYVYDLGRVYFSSSRFADARQSFENVTKLSPSYEPAWYNLGGTLRQLNRSDDALAALPNASTAPL